LAEQLFCKQQVTGSIPVAGSSRIEIDAAPFNPERRRLAPSKIERAACRAEALAQGGGVDSGLRNLPPGANPLLRPLSRRGPHGGRSRQPGHSSTGPPRRSGEPFIHKDGSAPLTPRCPTEPQSLLLAVRLRQEGLKWKVRNGRT
jgi:hypothetical protein